MSNIDNLQFIPKPIDAVGVRPGEGPNIRLPIGMIQRMAALRAYNNFSKSVDWMEKLSNTYVVAIATRSADTLLMKYIQDDLSEKISINCDSCREASIGISLIRERLFPQIKLLRECSNKLIHHLDDLGQKGIAGLNIEGVYSYCYQLFQENNEALFGTIPNPNGKFSHKKCKKCKA